MTIDISIEDVYHLKSRERLAGAKENARFSNGNGQKSQADRGGRLASDA
jgi:hypothetical protein